MDWNPVWSADGKHLYFVSDRGGSMNLWRVPIDEEAGNTLGPPEAVTTGAAASSFHISISKDGGSLAHVVRVTESNIWKVAFDPTTRTIVGEPAPVTQDSRRADYLDISPDGEWLAYRSIRGEQEDINIMSTNGTSRLQLTDDNHIDRRPRWSPDGKKIAFDSNRSGSFEIWTINPDGSGLKQLTETPGQALRNPAWSPEGSRIACFNSNEKATYIFESGKPWNEQISSKLLPFGKEDEWFEVGLWSPDGRWLAGTVNSPRGVAGIAVYSLTSLRYTRLTNFGRRPKWTNDSRALIFFNAPTGFHIVDIESEEVQELLSLSPDILWDPSLTADNHWIYFERVKDEADIWMVTLNGKR